MEIDERERKKTGNCGNAEPYARYKLREVPGGEGKSPVTAACSEDR